MPFNFPTMPADVYQSETVESIFPVSTGPWNSYEAHQNPEANYLASWGNPHWAYFSGIDDWLIDGNKVAYASYFGLVESQRQLDPSLPGGGPGTMTDQILSPIVKDNGQQAFLGSYCGGRPWIGVSRFQVASVQVPASVQLSSTVPGVWAATECTMTPGTDIVVSGFGSAPQLELTLCDFATPPYLQLALAASVSVTWDAANVSAMQIEAVGQDGAVTVLGTSQTTYEFGAGNETDYAGSWAIDNGCGVVTDLGIDTGTKGISTGEMGSPLTSFNFELAAGYAYRSLRFLVTPEDPSQPVTLHWPSFALHSEHPTLVWESSKACVFLYANGPGLRFGQWQFVVPNTGFQCPPQVVGLGTPTTIIDALAFRHLVLAADAGSANMASTLTAEVAGYFDSFEGQAINVVDKFSKGVPMPQGADNTIRFALVNSMSEIPPMRGFPRRQRGADWSESGDWGLVAYDWTQGPRYIVSAGSQIDLFVEGEQWTTPAVESVPGWTITQHDHAVDGTESDARLKAGSVEIAHAIRPWHGWFVDYLEGALPGVDMCRDHGGVRYAIYTDPTGVNVWRFSFPDSMGNPGISDVLNVSADTTIATAKIAYHPGGYLVAVYEKSSTLYRIENWAQGEAGVWSTPVSIGSGTLGAHEIDDHSGIEYDVYHNGTAFVCQRSVDSGVTWTTGGTIVSADPGSVGLRVGEDVSHMLVAVISVAGVRRRYVSLDQGDNWTED